MAEDIIEQKSETEDSPNLLQEFDLGKLVFVIKKSFWWSMLILIFCGLGTYLYLRWSQNIYEASATIQLGFKSSAKLAGLELAQGFNDAIDQVNLGGERALIRSPRIYSRVLNSLNLNISCYFEGEILDNERYPSHPFKLNFEQVPTQFYDRKISFEVLNENEYLLTFQKELIGKFNFGNQVDLKGFKFTINRNSQEETGKYYFIVNSEKSLYAYLNKNLIVNILDANRLQILFREKNRKKAIDIVGAITRSYGVISIEEKNRVFEQSIEYLTQNIRQNRDTLEFYDRALFAYRKANLLSPKQSNDFSSLFNRIENLENTKVNLRNRINFYDQVVQAINGDSSSAYLLAIAPLTQNSNVTSAITELIAIRDELDNLLQSYKETTGAAQQRNFRLEKAKFSLNEFITYDYLNLYQQIDKINQQIVEIEQGFLNFTFEQEDTLLTRIQRSRTIYGQIVNTLSNKVIEMNISKAGTVPDFRILSNASASETPIAPVKNVIYAIGGGIWLVISLLIIVIKYLLQNRINSLKEVNRLSKVPLLGIIPKYNKQVMDYSQLVAHINPKSSISEALRSVRTNLDFLNTDKQQKIISVTSTISGEGKTFVAVNLAGIIAMSDAKVIVLDLDLRKPKIHFAFNVENTEGVSSILASKADYKDCIHDTKIETLKFITAGPIPPNPSELILSEAFNQFLETLKQNFDVIVFDTPPVGLVTDGLIAMQKVNFPIYVVRANYSKLHFIYNANNLLNSNKFKNISLILNSVDFKNTYGYGYGSYGGYGYGGGYGTYGYGARTSYGYYEEDKPQNIFQKVFRKRNK